MQVRISDDYWSSLDAKLVSVKKKEVSFFFIIMLIIIAVFLYLRIVHFDQKENEKNTLPKKPLIKNPILSKI